MKVGTVGPTSVSYRTEALGCNMWDKGCKSSAEMLRGPNVSDINSRYTQKYPVLSQRSSTNSSTMTCSTPKHPSFKFHDSKRNLSSNKRATLPLRSCGCTANIPAHAQRLHSTRIWFLRMRTARTWCGRKRTCF